MSHQAHEIYLEQQEDNRLEEEEHKKFVLIQEFSSLVLSEGPNAVLSQIDPEAKEELLLAFKGV